MKTNRELYKAIETLIKEKENSPVISLEEYLISLLGRGLEKKRESELSLNEFFSLLSDSFSPWRKEIELVNKFNEDEPGFSGWQATLRRQIKDLKEMKRNGILHNEYMALGIDSPSGQRWYNFDPFSYIECGVAGSLGGWEDGDGTGRQYVPGEVATVNEQGVIVLYDPIDLDEPPREIEVITWDDFKYFLWCGQNYE